MKLYFPEIYPDELAYSWFARYCVYEGLRTKIQISNTIYCNKLYYSNKSCDAPSKEFIGNINDDIKKYIENMYTLKNFVLDHTMYPQYARFVSLERKLNALQKLCYEYQDSRLLFSIMPRCSKEQYLKYCPLCTQEDREKYGETYWHRTHQIRNMIVCRKHKCKLNDSNIFINSKPTRLFITAESVLPYNDDVIETNSILQLKLAEYMEQMFYEPIDFTQDISLKTILYYNLKDTEYFYKEGKIYYRKKLFNDISNYYNNIEFDEPMSKNRLINTLAGLVPDVPIICLLGLFLKIPIKNLTSLKLTEKDIEQNTKKRYNKLELERYDNDIVKNLEKFAFDVYNGLNNDLQKPGRVSEKMICRELNINRYNFQNMHKCNNILNKYYETYPEFWARKLIWAYNKLENEQGNNFILKDLINLSGVVKTNYEKIYPYLRKHTDMETVKKITNIIYCKK